jgi:hypothetical protein
MLLNQPWVTVPGWNLEPDNVNDLVFMNVPNDTGGLIGVTETELQRKLAVGEPIRENGVTTFLFSVNLHDDAVEIPCMVWRSDLMPDLEWFTMGPNEVMEEFFAHNYTAR